MSLVGIVQAWQPWWLAWQLPAAVVFFVAGVAEIRRPPFDMPLADSELVFGYLTEYTGLRFALFLLAEYAGIVVISALTAVLFLGGWRGPLLPAPVWTLVKTFALSFVVIWLRGLPGCGRISCSGWPGWCWCRSRLCSWCSPVLSGWSSPDGSGRSPGGYHGAVIDGMVK